MNEQKIKRIFIPGGLTRKLQPLDIGINKPFKEPLRKKFNLYQQTKIGVILTFKIAKIERKMILHKANEIWYSDTEIKKESILNSFKKSGITLKLDGSEDDMIDEVYENENEFINANDNKTDESDGSEDNDSENSI